MPGITFLAVLPMTLFVIAAFHHTKYERHILPMYPPMLVLAGVAGTAIWEWLRSRGPGVRMMFVAALCGIMVLHAATIEHKARASASRIRRAAFLKDVSHMDYVSEQAREHRPVLIVGTGKSVPLPPVADWLLVSKGRLRVTSAGYPMDPQKERSYSRQIDRARIPHSLRANARRVFGRYDTPTMMRSIYAISENQKQYEAALTATIEADPPQSIIALIGTSDTTRYPLGFIAPGILRAGYRQVSVREFPRAGTRVYVYRRQ